MPTNLELPTRQHDATMATHRAAEQGAWLPGRRVRLDLNAEAAAQLRDALDVSIRSGLSEFERSLPPTGVLG